VLRGRPVVTRLQVVAVAALAALCAWTTLSALWAPDQHEALLEAQRTLAYVAALVAAVAVGGALLLGSLSGIVIVCGYAVGQRLLDGPPSPPDPFEGTLLSEPLGYANGLGGMAAIGLAAAAALLLGDARLRVPLAAIAALLLATLAMTGSRGGWIAAVVGTAVAVALGLGRRRLAWAITIAAGLALVVALVLPAGSLADDLARHGGDRPYYWHVAWQQVSADPFLGAGAGSFHLAWVEERPIPADVRDAHSLHLETLAELGVIGLVLLALALAPPFLAGSRGSVAAAATGGYVAFLVHAGLDWDWELPAVTLAGLLCGAALLADGRQEHRASFAAAQHLHLQSETTR
jgi:O-antigen ligase